MKILVTGGGGFIGAYLVKSLIDKKHNVLSVDKLYGNGAIPFVHPKSKFIKGDILNKEILGKIKKWKPENYLSLSCTSWWRKRI